MLEMRSIDESVTRLHRDFVGADAYPVLVERYVQLGLGVRGRRYEQVLTSASTRILGTGLKMSSVQADYTQHADMTLRVVNTGRDKHLTPVRTSGTSRARDDVGLCRTVVFDGVPVEGDYWIFYISRDLSTFMVAAPLLAKSVAGCLMLSGAFGLYVLSTDRGRFWSDPELVRAVYETARVYGFIFPYNEPVVSPRSLPLSEAERTGAVVTSRRIRW
jgi:hypothetical protein